MPSAAYAAWFAEVTFIFIRRSGTSALASIRLSWVSRSDEGMFWNSMLTLDSSANSFRMTISLKSPWMGDCCTAQVSVIGSSTMGRPSRATSAMPLAVRQSITASNRTRNLFMNTTSLIFFPHRGKEPFAMGAPCDFYPLIAPIMTPLTKNF